MANIRNGGDSAGVGKFGNCAADQADGRAHAANKGAQPEEFPALGSIFIVARHAVCRRGPNAILRQAQASRAWPVRGVAVWLRTIALQHIVVHGLTRSN